MRLISIVVLTVLATAAVAGGPVYRYVDKDGVAHYTDKPPTPDAQPANLPALQTISPATPLSEVAPEAAAAAPAATPAAASNFTLKITSPAADETFRNDDGRLQVSTSSSAPLPEGVGLLYLLDGGARNRAPVRDMSFTIDGLERGEHSVAVAAVDASGKEITRSAAVTVHIKPPTVDMAPKRPAGPK